MNTNRALSNTDPSFDADYLQNASKIKELIAPRSEFLCVATWIHFGGIGQLESEHKLLIVSMSFDVGTPCRNGSNRSPHTGLSINYHLPSSSMNVLTTPWNSGNSSTK